VRRADVTRSHNAPSRIEPHRGKVGKDDLQPSSHKEGRVFHKCVSRLYLVNNSRHLAPKSRARAGEAGALAGAADVLARKSSRNHINAAPPRLAVKGADVIPDGKRGERAVVLSLNQYARGVWLPLDGADGGPPEELSPEDAAPGPGEEGELSKARRRAWLMIHVMFFLVG
jgi:hypothetical protein